MLIARFEVGNGRLHQDMSDHCSPVVGEYSIQNLN